LTEGAYRTRLLAGETLFYAVEIQQARRMSAQVTFTSRGPHGPLPIHVRVYNPLRSEDGFAHRAALLKPGEARSLTTSSGVVGRDPAYPEAGVHHVALSVGSPDRGVPATEITARLKIQIERREEPAAAGPTGPTAPAEDGPLSGLWRLFLLGAGIGIATSWVRSKLTESPRSLRHGL